MELAKARAIAAAKRAHQRLNPLLESGHALVCLDDRITKLEKQIKNDTGYREMKTLYNQIVKENNTNYEKIKQFETQRNELLAACKELIIESANNITNEGHDGIEANKDNIALIEKITGKIWQEI